MGCGLFVWHDFVVGVVTWFLFVLLFICWFCVWCFGVLVALRVGFGVAAWVGCGGLCWVVIVWLASPADFRLVIVICVVTVGVS